MSSWLNSIKDSIESIQKTTESTLQQTTKSIQRTTASIQKAIPINAETIVHAITLTTPEIAEQQKILIRQERRKDSIRDNLSRLLPWETNREEHELLVDDCHTAILALSTVEKTFLENVEERSDFPPLLREFNLDMHVGLIQRMLDIDGNLLEIHSKNSCGGEKERLFWKNYFYNCAIARETIGLSVAEIWLEPEEETESKSNTEVTVESNVAQVSLPPGSVPTQTINNDDASNAEVTSTENVPSVTTVDNNEGFEEVDSPPSGEYEIVGEKELELDDLAAEIARELEN